MNFSYPRHFRSKIKGMEKAHIQWNDRVVGWYTVVMGNEGEPLGGGTAESLELSQRIAVAESIEKLEVLHGLSVEERQSFKCERFPTRCGMAAGFEPQATIHRAIAEGVERWVWSKWIDDGLEISEIKLPKLNDLSNYCFSIFDEVRFFKLEIHHKINNFPGKINFYATIGFKDGGAFPGSRICGPNVEFPPSYAT